MEVIHVKASILMEEYTPKSVFRVCVYFEGFYHHMALKDLLSVSSGYKVTCILFLQVLHTSNLGKIVNKMLNPRRKKPVW